MSQVLKDTLKDCRIAKKTQLRVYRVTPLPRTILLSSMTFSSKFQQPESLPGLGVTTVNAVLITNPAETGIPLHPFTGLSADLCLTKDYRAAKDSEDCLPNLHWKKPIQIFNWKEKSIN